MASTIRTNKIGPVSGSVDLTLPTADGSAKSALITDGSKVLSFATGTPSASNFLRGDGTWADAGGGKILQVVHTSVTAATFSTSSTTALDITGMTVDIQPSATTSKILLTAVVNFDMSATTAFAGFLAFRDSTAIDDGIGTGVSGRIACAAWGSNYSNQSIVNRSMTFLDEPSSTSTITYKLQVDIDAGTFYLNRSYTDTDNPSFGRTISTLTAMEVGA